MGRKFATWFFIIKSLLSYEWTKEQEFYQVYVFDIYIIITVCISFTKTISSSRMDKCHNENEKEFI